MRTRATVNRMAELTRWVSRNKKASFHDFMREAGGTQSQYYHIRSNLGLAQKNPKISVAMKELSKSKASKQEDALTKIQKDNEEYLSKIEPPQPQKEVEAVKDSSAPDFIWYEMDLMQRRLGDVSTRLNHIMKVSQSRDGDQKRMMRELINENTTLRIENSNLKQQVSELTEMINGTPV